VFGAATFAFFVSLDSTDFSRSESDSAFRFAELAARCCGIMGTMNGVKQDLKERESEGRIDHARVMTKLYNVIQ
jgi:hypothetical protein